MVEVYEDHKRNSFTPFHDTCCCWAIQSKLLHGLGPRGVNLWIDPLR